MHVRCLIEEERALGYTTETRQADGGSVNCRLHFERHFIKWITLLYKTQGQNFF